MRLSSLSNQQMGRSQGGEACRFRYRGRSAKLQVSISKHLKPDSIGAWIVWRDKSNYVKLQSSLHRYIVYGRCDDVKDTGPPHWIQRSVSQPPKKPRERMINSRELEIVLTTCENIVVSSRDVANLEISPCVVEYLSGYVLLERESFVMVYRGAFQDGRSRECKKLPEQI